MRELPPLVPDAAHCAVCGASLDGEACGMCGAPRLRRIPEAEGFRCPFCRRGIPTESTECPFCLVDFVGRDRQEALRIRCPICGAEADASREACRACGSALFAPSTVDVVRPPKIRCPACGAEATEDDVECAACRRLLWQFTEKEWLDQILESLERAKLEMRLTDEESWMDLGDAPSLLTEAERALTERRFALALRSARGALRVAQGARVQAKMFLDAFRSASARLADAKLAGADTGAGEGLLGLASEARRRKDFRAAVRMALRARIWAEESLAKHRGARPAA